MLFIAIKMETWKQVYFLNGKAAIIIFLTDINNYTFHCSIFGKNLEIETF